MSEPSGIIQPINGGTGVTSLQAVLDTLGVTSGSYLRGNALHITLSPIQAGDVPTLNQNTTGSAATLTTARTINGVSFNGSANITLPYIYHVPWLDNPLSGSTALTAFGSGAAFFRGTPGNSIRKLDLVGYTQCRIMCFIGTNGATGSKLQVMFKSSIGSTVGTYANIGNGITQLACAMDNGGGTLSDSGWQTIDATAAISPCYVAVATIGGDGSTNPTAYSIIVEFK